MSEQQVEGQQPIEGIEGIVKKVKGEAGILDALGHIIPLKEGDIINITDKIVCCPSSKVTLELNTGEAASLKAADHPDESMQITGADPTRAEHTPAPLLCVLQNEVQDEGSHTLVELNSSNQHGDIFTGFETSATLNELELRPSEGLFGIESEGGGRPPTLLSGLPINPTVPPPTVTTVTPPPESNVIPPPTTPPTPPNPPNPPNPPPIDHAQGTISGLVLTFEDGEPHQNIGDTTRIADPITIDFVPADNEVVLSITFLNIPLGATISDGVHTLVGDGSTSFTVLAANLGHLTYMPAVNNSDVDQSINFIATIQDPDSHETANINGVLTVGIDAVADKPTNDTITDTIDSSNICKENDFAYTVGGKLSGGQNVGDSNTFLYKVNLFSGESTQVGGLTIGNDKNIDVQSMDLNPIDGKLYALVSSGQNAGSIFQIDPTTASTILFQSQNNSLSGTTNIAGFTFADDGTLYAVVKQGGTSLLFSISLDLVNHTDTPSLIGDTHQDLGGLALDPLTGDLYAVGKVGGNFDLFLINKITAQATDIGTIGQTPLDLQSLEFDGAGILWAVDSKTGDIYTIDPATGHATFTSNTISVNHQTTNGFESLAIGNNVAIEGGSQLPVHVSAQFNDLDGSEDHFFLVQLPTGWSAPAGSILVVDPAGLPAGIYVKVDVADNVANPTATINLTAPSNLASDTLFTIHSYAIAQEVHFSGIEFNFANNIAISDAAAKTVTVCAAPAEPVNPTETMVDSVPLIPTSATNTGAQNLETLSLVAAAFIGQDEMNHPIAADPILAPTNSKVPTVDNGETSTKEISYGYTDQNPIDPVTDTHLISGSTLPPDPTHLSAGITLDPREGEDDSSLHTIPTNTSSVNELTLATAANLIHSHPASDHDSSHKHADHHDNTSVAQTIPNAETPHESHEQKWSKDIAHDDKQHQDKDHPLDYSMNSEHHDIKVDGKEGTEGHTGSELEHNLSIPLSITNDSSLIFDTKETHKGLQDWKSGESLKDGISQTHDTSDHTQGIALAMNHVVDQNESHAQNGAANSHENNWNKLDENHDLKEIQQAKDQSTTKALHMKELFDQSDSSQDKGHHPNEDANKLSDGVTPTHYAPQTIAAATLDPVTEMIEQHHAQQHVTAHAAG